MIWSDQVAALCFQVPEFQISDFDKLIKAPDEVIDLSPMVAFYLRCNPDWQKNSEQIIKEFRESGLSFITPLSLEYPSGFRMMVEPPVFVSYIGHAESLSKPSIAVVGSREPSNNGKQFLDLVLSDFLKLRPVGVVSGAARGIDQAAHRCAIRNKCSTIAVLPSGIRNPYPSSIHDWFDDIIDSGGCIISEYQPQEFMQRHYFHRRNQLIVGLANSLFVVEARRRSGTSMTARHALDNSCDVAVAPGHALDPQYGGSLDLINDGGTLIRDHLDLVVHFDNSACMPNLVCEFENSSRPTS